MIHKHRYSNWFIIVKKKISECLEDGNCGSNAVCTISPDNGDRSCQCIDNYTGDANVYCRSKSLFYYYNHIHKYKKIFRVFKSYSHAKVPSFIEIIFIIGYNLGKLFINVHFTWNNI